MTVKHRFYEIMDKIVASKKDNNFYLDRDKNANCLEEVKTAKNVKNKKAVRYRRIKRYDILTIGGEEKLIALIKEENGEIKYYVCYDDILNILEETHLAVGHGGRTRMLKKCKKMKAKSSDKYPNVKLGQNVKLKVPDIDRAKTDPKSIIAVVIDVKDNEFYQLGTNIGVLKQLYTQNQFTSCSQDFITIEDVVKDKEVSLREVVGKLSLTGGQGFKKCNCLKKCLSKKCACKSSGLLCNSKCQNSTPCCNK